MGVPDDCRAPSHDQTEYPYSGSHLERQPHGRDRQCRHPFLAPGEAKMFGSRRLDRDPIDRRAGDRGKARADCVAMWADLWPFANDGRIDMRDHAAAVAQPLRGGSQKDR